MKKNTWKKIAAGTMAMALVAGMAPANVGGFLTRSTEIVAKAYEPETGVIESWLSDTATVSASPDYTNIMISTEASRCLNISSGVTADLLVFAGGAATSIPKGTTTSELASAFTTYGTNTETNYYIVTLAEYQNKLIELAFAYGSANDFTWKTADAGYTASIHDALTNSDYPVAEITTEQVYKLAQAVKNDEAGNYFKTPSWETNEDGCTLSFEIKDDWKSKLLTTPSALSQLNIGLSDLSEEAVKVLAKSGFKVAASAVRDDENYETEFSVTFANGEQDAIEFSMTSQDDFEGEDVTAKSADVFMRAIKDGASSITLGDDIVLSDESDFDFKVTSNLTLDLNDHNLTLKTSGETGIYIYYGAALTITGNGTISGIDDFSVYGDSTLDKPKLVIQGGNFTLASAEPFSEDLGVTLNGGAYKFTNDKITDPSSVLTSLLADGYKLGTADDGYTPVVAKTTHKAGTPTASFDSTGNLVVKVPCEQTDCDYCEPDGDRVIKTYTVTSEQLSTVFAALKTAQIAPTFTWESNNTATAKFSLTPDQVTTLTSALTEQSIDTDEAAAIAATLSTVTFPTETSLESYNATYEADAYTVYTAKLGDFTDDKTVTSPNTKIGKPALSEIEGLTADKIVTYMAEDSGESYWYDHTYEGKEFDIFGTIADGYGVGIFDNRIVKITSRNGKRISGVVLHSNWDNDTEYQMTATSGTFDKDHAIAQGEEVTLRDVNAKEVTISSNSQTWLQFDWITVYYVDALDETTDPEEEVTVPDDVIPAISQEELAAMAIQFATENNIQPTINIENQTATIKLTSDQVSALNGVASVDSAVLAALTEGVTVPIIVTPNTDGTYQVVVKLNDAVLYSTTYGTPTVDPVEDEPDETIDPVEDETTAPVEDETTAPVEDETTAPVEDETTAPVEDETTAPVEDKTDETTAPVEDEPDETTAPTEKVVDEKELSDEFQLPENAQEIKPEKTDENGNQTASLENAKPDSASTISYDEMTITLDEGTMKLLEQFCGGSLAGVTVDVSTKIMSDQLNEKQATIFEMAQKNNSLLKAFDFTIKQNGKATNLNTKGDGKMFIDIPLDNVAAAMKLMSVYLDENGNLLEMKFTLYVKDGETYARIFTTHNSVYMLIDAESELAKSVVTLAQQEAAEDTASSASETETPAEEATEAPAEEATEAPAEEATEAPAEEATEAPTEAATEAPTEAATEAPTTAPAANDSTGKSRLDRVIDKVLPRTGNNNPFKAGAVAAALGLTSLGSFALWKSGIFRKKKDDE